MANKKALIISDGKPGHFNQSVGLCQKLLENNFLCSFKTLEIPQINKKKKIIDHFMAIVNPSLLLNNYSHVLSRLDFKDFDIIISTGSTASIFSHALRKKYKLPVIQILRPLPFLSSDIILLPSHDNIFLKKNVMHFLIGLSTVNEHSILKKVDRLDSRLKDKDFDKNKAVTLLIGGDSKNYSMKESEMIQFFNTLVNTGVPLLFTTSRRTPMHIAERLKSISEGKENIKLNIFVDCDNFNPMPQIFSLTKRTLVTEDSFSMISESVSSGNITGILLSKRCINKKLRRSISKFIDHGIVFPVRCPEDIMAFLKWSPSRSFKESEAQILNAVKELLI